MVETLVVRVAVAVRGLVYLDLVSVDVLRARAKTKTKTRLSTKTFVLKLRGAHIRRRPGAEFAWRRNRETGGSNYYEGNNIFVENDVIEQCKTRGDRRLRNFFRKKYSVYLLV